MMNSMRLAFPVSFLDDGPATGAACCEGGGHVPYAPVKAPWVHLGAVVHQETIPVTALLTRFALTLRDRGFLVAGLLPTGPDGVCGSGERRWHDLSADRMVMLPADQTAQAAAGHLRWAMRENADLLVMGDFPAFRAAVSRLATIVGQGAAADAVQPEDGPAGLPALTAFPGRDVGAWQDFAGRDGTMLAPDMAALWRWWGPDHLYRDLALGVADDEVRQIACGQRWIMVEGPHGSGLAYLPRYPKTLLPRLPALARGSLRQLAELSASWDPVEMALGIAAINAHYNRSDVGGHMGNGAHLFAGERGRVVAIGAFPGLAAALPGCTVIETDPRPGEYPLVAMDTLLPGCAAVVVNSSSIINRSLPRILRLAQGARAALVGPTTPLSPRLYSYGVEVLGGLVVRDPKGLAAVVKRGGLPREFAEYGQYLYLRRPWGHCRSDEAGTAPASDQRRM